MAYQKARYQEIPKIHKKEVPEISKKEKKSDKEVEYFLRQIK